MHYRELKSILVTVAGSLSLVAAVHAAQGQASTPAPGAGSATPAPAASGAADPAGTAAGTPGAAASPATAGAVSAAADIPDNEIVALVLAIDDNEIKAAEAAGKKKMGKDAQGFAKMLLKQHRADSNKVAKLAAKLKIEPAASASRVEELKSKGAADLQSLSAKDSLEFEQGYIAAMVQGHTEALALFDDHLIKDADAPRLKKQLEETRKHVAAHLEHAKRLQGARASR